MTPPKTVEVDMAIPRNPKRLNRVKQMLAEGRKYKDIARSLKITRQALWQYIKRHNLDGRPRRRGRWYFIKWEQERVRD
jgi:DNA invertase Pin-like site-specific DNA recombinase